jgi:hypothetical protein
MALADGEGDALESDALDMDKLLSLQGSPVTAPTRDEHESKSSCKYLQVDLWENLQRSGSGDPGTCDMKYLQIQVLILDRVY